MSGDWLALATVAALATAGAIRSQGSAQRQVDQGTITRNGFPWPERTILFHGTAAMNAIARQGFRTRAGGAPAMAGGGHHKSVSTTLVTQRAVAIALGLHTMARVAQRDLGLADLFYALQRDAPKTAAGGLVDFTDWVRSLGAMPGTASQSERIEQILGNLDLLDAGWTYVYLSRGDSTKKVDPYRVPRGSIELHRDGDSWLIPPGSPLPLSYDDLMQVARRQIANPSDRSLWARERSQGWHHGRCDAAFRIYNGITQSASFSKEVFYPHFIGTDVAALARVPLASIGVLRVTASIPRICVDPRGAVRLGYLQRRDPVRRDKLDTWYRTCADALEEHEVYGDAPPHAERELFGLWDTWIKEPARWQGWAVEQQGRRTSSSTMLYYDGEEEVRIYDPSRIQIVSKWTVPQLRAMFKLGDRVTLPWFDPKEIDVTVWHR